MAAVLAAAGLLAGCSSGGHPHPAPSGPAVRAVVLARVTGQDPAQRAVSGPPAPPSGMSSGPDGSVYFAADSSVVRIAKGKVTVAADRPATGVTALPDGSVVTARLGQLLRLAPGRPAVVLAGVRDRFRSVWPVSSGGNAATSRFTTSLTPIGTLGDGSLVAVDGDAAWLLRRGRLTRLYRHVPPAAANGTWPVVRGGGSTVSPTGTLFLLPGARGTVLRDTLVVAPTGKATTLRLPASVPGVDGDPGGLTPAWLATDGRNGVYVHAFRAARGGRRTADYVLHVHDGTAELTAASAHPDRQEGCAPGASADARKYPCALPWAVLGQPGLLVLAGRSPYVVGVPLPRS